MPAGLWGVCEEALPVVVAPGRMIESFTDTPPPVDQTAITLWWTLCLHDQAVLAQRDVDVEIVDAVVHQITNRPGPEGSLHPSHEDDEDHAHEPTDRWIYDELCGLHALANLALGRRNRAWAHRVEQIALHHMNHTQPDHVTTQPWAVFAFVWSSQTRHFADQVIHDATAGRDGSTRPMDPVAAMLLADAVSALSIFED